ncbi:reverse transcriptase domain-containing protein [Tanacetum coccineum]|uniref:Reverse transcriptase domain-containing protein n=1 Tax=Tanacetum coccineum TaxID=301880 RepID=A0ABQ5D9X4_9ASTR
MPTWCHMFNSTLTGNAREWFDDLPAESIDNYDDLKKAFLENYLHQKKYIKDPIELHNIKQRDGESTEDFVRRYKLESRDVKGAPECMRISEFVHGITNPELIKRLHDKIPKTVDEMMRVTTSFLEGELEASNHERKKSLPPWKQQEGTQRRVYVPKETNRRNAQGRKAFAPIKGAQTEQWKRAAQDGEEMRNLWERQSISHPNDEDEGTEGPMIIEAEIGGHCIHRMYVDGVSASKILYEHFFNRLRPEIKNQLVPATTPLIGFSGEIIWPIGQIQLLIGSQKLQAVPSIAHGMLKLPVEGGVITLKSSRLVPLECALVSGPEETSQAPKPMVEERVKHNFDIFAWKPADMTGVPRHIAEHRLNVREGCSPVRQKKRGQAVDKIKQYRKKLESL